MVRVGRLAMKVPCPRCNAPDTIKIWGRRDTQERNCASCDYADMGHWEFIWRKQQAAMTKTEIKTLHVTAARQAEEVEKVEREKHEKYWQMHLDTVARGWAHNGYEDIPPKLLEYRLEHGLSLEGFIDDRLTPDSSISKEEE